MLFVLLVMLSKKLNVLHGTVLHAARKTRVNQMLEALATIIMICLMFVPLLNILVGIVGGHAVGGIVGAFIGFLIGGIITAMFIDKMKL